MSYAQIPEPHSRSSSPPSSRIHESIQMKSFFSKPFSTGEPKKPPVSPARRRKLLLSYAPDWLLIIILTAIFYSLDRLDGFRREFSLADTSLRHPFATHERVPNLALVFICFVAPLLLQPIINLITVRSWWDLHNSTLGLVLGISLTAAITQFTKLTVGRPRPDVISRCQPPPGLTDPEYGLTTSAVCTQVDLAILRDGFRSFPSGHSSLSFAGLGFLSFYLAGKLHLFDKRGHAGKAWIALTPFSAAALVAISRTMDYRHHWQDVLVGSILGTVLSYFAYRQYYPPLESELSHRPYSPRIAREDADVLPIHHSRDESVSTELDFRAPSAPDNGNRPTYPHSHSHSQSQSQSLSYGYQAGVGGDTEYHPPSSNLGGTVPRPGPGSLEQIWEEGADGSGGSGRDSKTPTMRSELDRRRTERAS